MDPVVHVPVAEGGLALSDLIFMVREYVIDATGVDIETLSQVLRGHGRALYVPARESGAPRAVPFHIPARLRSLPEGEIPGVSLQWIDFGTDAFQEVASKVVREFAVPFERRNIEV